MPAAARRARDTAPATRPLTLPADDLVAAWGRLRPLMRLILWKMLGSDEEVRDLLQEAFLQLNRSVRGLRSPGAIRPFAAGIAARLALVELRRRRVRSGQVLLPGQGLVPPESITPDPEAREAMAHLYGMMGQLREDDRELFVLRQIHGLEQSEISAALAVSISTVRRRLARLQRRLDKLVHADPALAAYAIKLGGRRKPRAMHRA